MKGASLKTVATLTWGSPDSSKVRARVLYDASGDRYLALGRLDEFPDETPLVSLAGYEALPDSECLITALLAGVLYTMDQAYTEFGSGALVVGNGLLARLCLRALKWRGCVPIKETASVTHPSEQESVTEFLTSTKRPVTVIETTGNGITAETLVRLLRHGDSLILLGGQECEITIYGYRDIHKKGLALVGMSPDFTVFFGVEHLYKPFLERALALIMFRGSGSVHSEICVGH